METEKKLDIHLADGSRFACSDFNSSASKVIVLVHGNMTDRNSWTELIRPLLSNHPEFRVFTIDQRGFGDSAYDTRVDSIEDFARDLAGVLTQMNFENVTVVGWSLGGAVVMQLAADFPLLVKNLVLVAGCHVEGFPLTVVDEATK